MRPTIQPGTRLGHYEILGVLGRGGMGVVWRGRDTRLHREVAIKTLPDALAQDAERLSRLTREARLLAALNHPHIAAIYGLEEHDTLRFLVLELVEGGTLADRLRHGAMPVGEALAIGLQIANALEAAHEKGIVHRDLKPGNITLTPDGRVKVLDFGLAKTTEPTPAEAEACTETLPATELGQVMGTPAYMSPEQARGEAAGVQADIWSFGVVLYELLTASSPFARATTTETLAAVLAGTPEYARLPAQTPGSVRRLIRRCLEPDRTRRFRHMGDVRIQLEDALEPDAIAAGTDAGVVRHETARGVACWSAGAAALAVLSIAAVLVLSPGGEPARPLRAEITTPASLAPHHFALSPDGRYIAYVASASPDSVLQILHLRDLETNDVRAMPETAVAKYPCWSPDSRSIARCGSTSRDERSR
jgi:eukaryotic-like serine/threonine-protein kinase